MNGSELTATVARVDAIEEQLAQEKLERDALVAQMQEVGARQVSFHRESMRATASLDEKLDRIAKALEAQGIL